MSQPPAFQFYASDYLSSSKVQRMSLEAEGAYIRLLAYNWQDGFIPADIDQLARMCKTTPRKMTLLWSDHLKDCFVLVDSDPGKYVNVRLEEVRQEQQEYRSRKAKAGAMGASARWSHKQTDGSAIDVPMANGMAKDSPSSPSSVSNKNTYADEYSSDFLEFWKAYPKKSGKRAAFKVWRQLKPPAELLARMLQTLSWQRVSVDWTKEKGKYIPDPERWLAKGKWDDEQQQAAPRPEKPVPVC